MNWLWFRFRRREQCMLQNLLLAGAALLLYICRVR